MGKKKETYKEYVERHRTKLTKDDTFTPDAVYETVKEWVVAEYGLESREIVRPFWPGEDYTAWEYPEGSVVIDNPPFSILSEIVDFYLEREIPFFLFAQGTTLFGTAFNRPVSCVVTGEGIRYENGANIDSGFLTNLADCKVHVSNDLKLRIRGACKKPNTNVRKIYPRNVISAALLSKVAARGNYKIHERDLHQIRTLEHQKREKKGIFGGGFLVSDRVADDLEKIAERQIGEPGEKWELSPGEKAIIEKLGK